MQTRQEHEMQQMQQMQHGRLAWAEARNDPTGWVVALKRLAQIEALDTALVTNLVDKSLNPKQVSKP